MSKIHILPISSIDDTLRAREDYGNITELAESIKRYEQTLPETHGLIHPILIDNNNKLVAGGRRLEAHRLLGRETVACLIVEELDEDDRLELEVVENVERLNMSWVEIALQVDKIHKLREKTAAQDGELWTKKATGKLLNLSSAHVTNLTAVATALREKNPLVVNAKNLTEAIQALLGEKEKAAQSELLRRVAGAQQATAGKIQVLDLDNITESVVKDRHIPKTPSAESLTELEITNLEFRMDLAFHNGNCIDVMKLIKSDSIDHIITDPPYGIDLDNLRGAKIEDMKETHKVDENVNLFHAFIPAAYRVLKPSGFLIMWYDLDHHNLIASLAQAAGFKVQRWPFVWCKSHACANNAAQFNFTKSTEVAMILRKSSEATLLKPQLNNYIVADGSVERTLYNNPFAKPGEVWTRLINSVALPGSTILDPFAGEMSCARACINLGMSFMAIELDKDRFAKGVTDMQKHLKELTGDNITFTGQPRVYES